MWLVRDDFLLFSAVPAVLRLLNALCEATLFGNHVGGGKGRLPYCFVGFDLIFHWHIQIFIHNLTSFDKCIDPQTTSPLKYIPSHPPPQFKLHPVWATVSRRLCSSMKMACLPSSYPGKHTVSTLWCLCSFVFLRFINIVVCSGSLFFYLIV